MGAAVPGGPWRRLEAAPRGGDAAMRLAGLGHGHRAVRGVLDGGGPGLALLHAQSVRRRPGRLRGARSRGAARWSPPGHGPTHHHGSPDGTPRGSPVEPVARSSWVTAAGVDIWRRALVLDAAANKHGRRPSSWKEVLAGEKAINETGNWLPDETVEAFRELPDRHQGAAHHPGRGRHPLPQRGAAPDPRPLRLPAPGALVPGRALPGRHPDRSTW